jgi:hypothetical protein
MATASQLAVLRAIHERSPEGLGVPEDDLRMDFPELDEDLVALEDEGLLVVVDHDPVGPDTVAVTDDGRRALGVSPPTTEPGVRG